MTNLFIKKILDSPITLTLAVYIFFNNILDYNNIEQETGRSSIIAKDVNSSNILASNLNTLKSLPNESIDANYTSNGNSTTGVRLNKPSDRVDDKNVEILDK